MQTNDLSEMHVNNVSISNLFYIGAGESLLARTIVDGYPAVVVVHAKAPRPDKVGQAPDPADLDPDWVRENCAVLAFTSPDGARLFMNMMTESIRELGIQQGWLAPEGERNEQRLH